VLDDGERRWRLVTTDYFLYPRTPPVSIGAHEQDSRRPGGQLHVLRRRLRRHRGHAEQHRSSAPPRLGQASTSITFGNLPAPSAAIALIGLSNTVAAFGPLPLDLVEIGGPSCLARVSLDATLFLTRRGWHGVPADRDPERGGPARLDLYHTQALVIDSTLNGLRRVGVGRRHRRRRSVTAAARRPAQRGAGARPAR
jgi:hypothetical protein